MQTFPFIDNQHSIQACVSSMSAAQQHIPFADCFFIVITAAAGLTTFHQALLHHIRNSTCIKYDNSYYKQNQNIGIAVKL